MAIIVKLTKYANNLKINLIVVSKNSVNLPNFRLILFLILQILRLMSLFEKEFLLDF